MWRLDDTTPITAIRNAQRPQFWKVTLRFINPDDTTLTYAAGDAQTGAGIAIANGAATYTEPFVPDLAAAPKLAADWLRQFNKIEQQTIDQVAFVGAVAALLTPPEPQPPTDEQLQFAAYQRAKQVLSQVQDLVTTGALAGDDPAITVAQDAVRAAAAPLVDVVKASVTAVAAQVEAAAQALTLPK